jgi:hypothetical protein
MDAASILLVLVLASATIGSNTESAAPIAKRHTSYFAGQSGWGTDMSNPPPAAAPTGNRYQFGTTGGSTAVTAPPSVVDRTQTAVSETSNALREGVDAGFQAANQQISQGGQQFIDSTRSAAQDLSKQFQGWAGTATQPAQITAPTTSGTLPPPPTTTGGGQVSNPFTTATSTAATAPAAAKSRSGIGPPPDWAGSGSTSGTTWPNDSAALLELESPRTATLSRAPVQTESGWTSVHSTVAPPAPAPPRLLNTSSAITPISTPMTGESSLSPLADSGPNFPKTVSVNQPIDHSVLSKSQSPSTPQPNASPTTNSGWDFGWDRKSASSMSTPAMVAGNRYDAATISSGNGANNVAEGAQSPPQTTAPPATGQNFGFGAWDKSGWPENPSVSSQGAQVAGMPGGTGVAPPPAGSVPPSGAALPSAGAGMPPSLPPSEDLPWMPLLVVSLALAGSIGANLFLGYSYADARHKYRTLVQKTANKFRRAAAA